MALSTFGQVLSEGLRLPRRGLGIQPLLGPRADHKRVALYGHVYRDAQTCAVYRRLRVTNTAVSTRTYTHVCTGPITPVPPKLPPQPKPVLAPTCSYTSRTSLQMPYPQVPAPPAVDTSTIDLKKLLQVNGGHSIGP